MSFWSFFSRSPKSSLPAAPAVSAFSSASLPEKDKIEEKGNDLVCKFIDIDAKEEEEEVEKGRKEGKEGKGVAEKGGEVKEEKVEEKEKYVVGVRFAYYIWFAQGFGKTKEGQGASGKDYAKKCAATWREMTDDQKKPFVDLMKNDLQRFRAEYREMYGIEAPENLRKDDHRPKRIYESEEGESDEEGGKDEKEEKKKRLQNLFVLKCVFQSELSRAQQTVSFLSLQLANVEQTISELNQGGNCE